MDRITPTGPPLKPSSPQPKPRLAAPSAFAQTLQQLGAQLDSDRDLGARVAAGSSPMGPAQLLALQAGIYRYSESVELVSKVVDKGAQGIRSTLQNQ